MGVPKFFRYMSERYPCLSEFIREYQIPDFDNLYLDMNGIIHNCSHPDDNNPHFRITEEKIFSDIFHYIEILFQMIKPRKVFFMAIDGVAPRAKMNQQRGRRFRTAKDAKKQEDEAIKHGEKLPTESRFDSNCITPGTEFMARLHEQLKYFVVKKISEDPFWQRCKIILSGHETPGEGEHKIMDFIRYLRSQPGYDPYTRHCLYGLDADLIMLGLCTHEPHFALLREEVKFGKKSTKKLTVPDEIRFFLLHLSLMREYLEMEFSALKETLKNFKFDIECIIDDWVLMGFLVGNDFIPNLPNLHIANGALPVLYKAYMEVLPQLDGYINEAGILNLQRFEILMKKLGEIDIQNFEEVKDDLLYMEAKTGRKIQPFAKNNSRNLEVWKLDKDVSLKPEFLMPLEDNKHKDSDLQALIAATENEFLDEDNEYSNNDEDEDDEFESYKRSYYMNKLEYTKVTPEVMRSQAEGYVRAIQWNLHYYYNGVCSWSWYYPHHYAPYISDIKQFQHLKLEYDIGKPFMPYEQLLAVLPSASKKLLPECFQKLMTEESSPIKKYYPENFDTDLNGKRQEWEAVVLVPFIDEDILLGAMKSCEDKMSQKETQRNKHGPMLCYTYTEENLGLYESPMYFPKIRCNHAKMQEITVDEIRVPRDKLIKGAYPGALMDIYYPGFPTFKHLQYQGRLKKAKVKVFEQASRGDNMIVQVIPSDRVLDAKLSIDLLGKTVYVGWPHLVESRVIEIMNSKDKYIYSEQGPRKEPSPATFNIETETVSEHYATRLGIEFGKILELVKVQTMIGQKYMFTSNGKVSIEKKFCENLSNYPLQLIIDEVTMYSEDRKVPKSLKDVFPINSTCFIITHNRYYGCMGIVKEDEKTPEGQLCLLTLYSDEPDMSEAEYMIEKIGYKYKTQYAAAREIGMSSYVFSRITGSFFTTARNRDGGPKTVNLGLDLKFNKKNLETPGYTKKIDGAWYYTDAAINLVEAYADEFPEVVNFIFLDRKEDTTIDDIFPDDSDAKTKAVLTWLKSQPHSQVEKRPCDAKILDDDVILEIQNIVDNFNPERKEVTLFYNPEFLFKEELCFGNLLPDSKVKLKLFDRIISTRANHVVPLGSKGTIIGIHKGTSETSEEYLCDVMFDKEFEGALEIIGSNKRGYRLPLNSFINISHGARLYQPKYDKQGDNHQNQQQKEYTYKRCSNYSNQSARSNNNVSFPNSAFAKFSNVPQSYNAVPPFMLNGDPIYKTNNSHYNNRNNSTQQNQAHKYRNFHGNSSTDHTSDSRNPFQKQYGAEKYNNVHTNTIPQPKIDQSSPVINIIRRKSDKNDSATDPKKTDFMPCFNKKTVEETADALKRILKIENNSIQKEYSPESHNVSCTKIEVDTSIGRNDVQPIIDTSVPFSVQLLSYYQAKGLGLPRYQYVNSEYGIQAQIRLPNRQILIGKPARSKEQSSEFVAEKALMILLKDKQNDEYETQSVKEDPVDFPTPPSQWCKQDQKVRGNKSTDQNFTNSKFVQNSWKNLIPLQVVKKEKAASSNTPTGSNMSINEKRNVLSDKPSQSVNEASPIVKKEHKPRRERKVRIAANFGTKP